MIPNWVSLLSFAVVNWLNGFAAINEINYLKHLPPLPDYGFAYLPQISIEYPDHLLSALIIFFLIRAYFYEDVQSMIKFSWSFTILFALRLITFSITMIPPTLPDCKGRNPGESYIWFLVIYLYENSGNTCIDLMFSGHAVYLTLICFYLIDKSVSGTIRSCYYLYWIIGLTSIVAAHLHYSSDVIIGTSLSIMMYKLTYNS